MHRISRDPGKPTPSHSCFPERIIGGVTGELLSALVIAGAFAAFLSTSSGLTVSVAGVLSQDLLAARIRDGVTAFRLGTCVAVVVPFLLALIGQRLGVANVVGLTFAVAASSFCPLLLLGIWWRRLTTTGAIAGLVIGGGLCATAVLLTISNGPYDGWFGTLLGQPAAWSVPLAFTTMVVVSLLTPARRPANVARTMVRLHTPEGLDVVRDSSQPWHR